MVGMGGGKVAGREEGGEVEGRLITGRLDSLESCVCGCALGGAARSTRALSVMREGSCERGHL